MDPYAALLKRYPAEPTSIPFLLIQGTADTAVYPAAARSYEAALLKAGYQSRLVEAEGANHESFESLPDIFDPIMKVTAGG